LQIIVVDRRLPRAVTLDVSTRALLLAGFGIAVAVTLAVVGLYAATFKLGTQLRIPVVQDVVSFIVRDEVARTDQFVRDNVAALARRLGEMQAQMMRLDALGERVSKMAGIRPEEFNFNELPGRGGAAPIEGRHMSLDELQQELDRLANGVAARADFLDVIESELVEAQVRRALLPQNAPVVEGFVGSPFGMRIDPFTGQPAMHAGLDFAAPPGTPIYAAAGGVVVTAEMHPIFGKMVEIDHGAELKTLYAHASRIDVKVGDIVRRGQKIAEVGSTGRSTGPHLHFEVHLAGRPQNPARFLAAQNSGSPFSPLVAASPSGRGVDVKGLSRAAGAAR
jgi:murein DD-endopeptidase MepM/ murein hydrolase activator NlpD